MVYYQKKLKVIFEFEYNDSNAYNASIVNESFSYFLNREVYRRKTGLGYRSNWQRLHLDGPLLLGMVTLMSLGFLILYAASGQNMAMVMRQSVSAGIAFACLFTLAQIPPQQYRTWSPWIYAVGLLLLFVVLIMGTIGKGAQRWLNLGFIRFQPSEIMKFAVPMIVAWYFSQKPLPPSIKSLIVASIFILVPGVLIAKQPDLGTALLVIFSGCVVLFFAGMSWRILAGICALVAIAAPILYQHLHTYQRLRVLTFLDPERDPLGSGYNIIQSKIAVGSGGFWGKGLFQSSQAKLHFLPEHKTDFIFAVCAEELGFLGCLLVIVLVLCILFRCLHIVRHAQDDFARLLAAGLSLSFFLSAFVNIGMVTGLLPVVGVPLPFVSYGGTSLVTLGMAFGILMSIHTHRDLFTNMPVR